MNDDSIVKSQAIKIHLTPYKKVIVLVSILASLVFFLFSLVRPLTASASSVNIWWPTNGAHVKDVQPFKAMISGMDVNQYTMYWQVDGGQLNLMNNNYTDYQHKEATVDLSGWNWHGSGPYVVNFVAKQNGSVFVQ